MMCVSPATNKREKLSMESEEVEFKALNAKTKMFICQNKYVAGEIGGLKLN